MGGEVATRLVLDTNVWLDWLVFDDPDVAPLKAALANGTAEVFMAPAGERELARVLGYRLRKSTLDTVAQAARLEQCRRLVRWMDDASSKQPDRLPVCRDPDDQKFLELARDCGADVLVTKDRALLGLVRRNGHRLPFEILTPTQAGDRLGSAPRSEARAAAPDIRGDVEPM